MSQDMGHEFVKLESYRDSMRTLITSMIAVLIFLSGGAATAIISFYASDAKQTQQLHTLEKRSDQFEALAARLQSDMAELKTDVKYLIKVQGGGQ